MAQSMAKKPTRGKAELELETEMHAVDEKTRIVVRPWKQRWVRKGSLLVPSWTADRPKTDFKKSASQGHGAPHSTHTTHESGPSAWFNAPVTRAAIRQLDPQESDPIFLEDPEIGSKRKKRAADDGHGGTAAKRPRHSDAPIDAHT